MEERLLEITFISPPLFGLVSIPMEARTRKQQGEKKSAFLFALIFKMVQQLIFCRILRIEAETKRILTTT